MSAPAALLVDVASEVTVWARDMLRPGAAVVLDTETTDLPGAVCELAVIDAATGAILLDTLINPCAAMHPGARAVHGIADNELASAPRWPQVLPRLRRITAGRRLLAYNAAFDADVITADCLRYGLSAAPFTDPARWSCVMAYRARWLRSDRPTALGSGHRALSDAHAARQVLLQIAAA
jgi:DNA polymerase III subunit epsilon